MPFLTRIGEIARDQQGNTLAIGAAALLPLLAVVGAGVDMSLAYRAKQRLQAACDAGVLAGRRTVTTNGFDTAAQNAAHSYFNNNFNPASLEVTGTSFTPSSPDNGGTVRGEASAGVRTLVMRLFGYRAIPISATCEATMGVGNSDVMMVLDVTGSMAQTLSGTSTTRIQALREAMKNFFDTVHTATAASNARIRYGFVPYSSTVNVGHLLRELNPNYLADSVAVQSRVPVFQTITENIFDGWSDPVSNTTSTSAQNTTSFSSWSRTGTPRFPSNGACSAALPPNTGWLNNGTPTTSTNTTTNGAGQQVTTTTVTQPQIEWEYRCNNLWHESRFRTRNLVTTTTVVRDPTYRQVTRTEFARWQYQQVTYDTSIYKNFLPIALPLGTNGVAQNFTWPGCIEERATTAAASFSYSDLFGISPSEATDLDLDTPPSSNPSSRWRPLIEGTGYYRTTSTGALTTAATSNYGALGYIACPRAARLLASMSQSEFYAYADSLQPIGGTYHDIGLIWGGRLASPQGMWADLVNTQPSNGAPVARHLIFMTDGIMEPNRLIHSAYGIEYHDRRVTNDGTNATATARHNSRFNAVCEAIKAKGIRLWVIVFESTLTTPLQNCASPESIFTANNSAQLNTAFQEIARRVGELRVIQ